MASSSALSHRREAIAGIQQHDKFLSPAAFIAEDLIDELLGRGHPNPSRVGCLPQETLIALARGPWAIAATSTSPPVRRTTANSARSNRRGLCAGTDPQTWLERSPSRSQLTSRRGSA